MNNFLQKAICTQTVKKKKGSPCLIEVQRSCICAPGHRQAFLLPDRSKYVNMEKRFLRSYMELLVQTCHRRGALATGGMAAPLLPPDPLSDSHRRVLAAVSR